ncbi:MAG: tetratricopeptide repeat protein [Pseudomonadota bacterium]
MSHVFHPSLKSVLGVAVAAALTTFTAPAIVGGAASAMGDAPKPKIDCRKRKNKERAECKKKSSKLTDDEVYQAGYLLASNGDYAKAKAMLLTAENQDDPRILNYLGFTTRKMGDPEAALAYYKRALDLRPDYAAARSYRGEALVELGRLPEAFTELTEIEKICGKACDPYAKLMKKLEAATAAQRTPKS